MLLSLFTLSVKYYCNIIMLCCKQLPTDFLFLSNSWQLSTEAAGRSLVSIIVDHIFLCIKDAGYIPPPLCVCVCVFSERFRSFFEKVFCVFMYSDMQDSFAAISMITELLLTIPIYLQNSSLNF